MRARLFLILIAATGLVWLSATAWVYLSTRAEVEHVLDARLMEAARMVASLIDRPFQLGLWPRASISGGVYSLALSQITLPTVIPMPTSTRTADTTHSGCPATSVIMGAM